MIPKTTTYKQFKEKKAREEAEAAASTQPGQTTLQNGVNGKMGVHSGAKSSNEHEEDDDESMVAEVSAAQPTNGSPIVDRTMPASTMHGHPHTDDVEMQG